MIMLAPSWGGMINGIMTLSGAWEKLRTDPVLRLLIVSISFYGMSTFEGPMMSIKTVNALSHYTDWTIGHVHSGALGWVAMVSIGAMYFLIPRLFGKQQVYSIKWDLTDQQVGVITIRLRPKRNETPLFGVPSRGSRKFMGLFSSLKVPKSIVSGYSCSAAAAGGEGEDG